MAELMDKQGILDELRRRSGGAQQEQTPLMDKQQILDYLRQRSSAQQQGTGTFAPVQQTPSAKDFAAGFLRKDMSGGREYLPSDYGTSATVSAGKTGWADYQAQQERYKNQPKEDPKEPTFWQSILEGIASIGSDTTLPGVGGSQVVAMSKEAQQKDTELAAPKDTWTDDERYDFGYLWNTERQKAWEYARAVNEAYAQADEAAAVEKAKQNASKNFGTGFGNTVGAVATAPLGLADTLEDMISYGATGHIQKADGKLSPFEWSQAATQGISEKLNEKGGTISEKVPVIGGKGWGDVYGLGTSIAKSITAAYTGGPGQALIVNFGPAMASATDDALSRGATDEQAMGYGFLSGLAEAAAEMVGVDNLLKLGAADSLKAVMKNLLKQGTTEALEEGLTSVVDNLADNLVLRDKSVLNKRIAAYTEQGMTSEQAKKQAWLDMAGDVIFDMLGGFVSGAASGGLETIVQTAPTLGRKPSGTAQQPQSATQSGETAKPEKVPTQAASAAGGQQTTQTVQQTAASNQQTMTPQQAMQETIAEIIGVPSVSQAVESYRESGTVTNKQAEAIVSNANAVQELLELAGIAKPSTKSQTRAAVKQAVAKLAQESVDNAPTGDYDRITNQGGNAYAEQNTGAQYSAGAIGTNDDFAGVQAESRGTSFEDIRQQGRYAERDEDLRTRLSGALEGELERRGYRHGNADGLHLSSGKGQTFEVLSVDASTFHDIFEVARKYTKNGELVDLHDVKTTEDGVGYEDCENYISADGMSGFSITPDGDLISVFNAHGLKKKGFLRAIAPVVKAKVKTLDCYMSEQQPLHEIYEKVFGMKIASVMEHNMLYDHDSIATNHGNPKVAFMVNSDADVAPEFFGKEDYNAAKAHQVSAVQSETTKSTLPEHAVGANKSDFEHRQARSAVYENTYQNATDKDVLDIGIKAEVNDPNIGNYDVVTEKESLANAELRTRNAEETMFEYEDLVSKSGWSGEDNDTAFRVLDILNKTGKTEEFKKLARKQREEATRGGQLTQSFAKYSRMNGAAAAAEVVADLDKLNESDVPKRFYQDGGFDKWKGDVITSSMNIAKQIDSVEDGDVDGMKDIIRSMAKWRKTTAWFGLSSDLSKAAEAAMKDIDFETAKAIANAQLSTLPTDFKKRPVGQVVKTIRIHNMLSALTTINRNLVGNTAVGFIDATSDSTSGRLIDALISKVTGKRTVGNDIKHGKTYMDAAWKATKMASLCAELDIPMDSESRFTTGTTRTYSPQGNPIMRFMSAYEKYMKYALEVTDQFYQGGANAAVDASLQEISGNGTLTQKEAEAVAKLVGQRRTLKDERAATRMAKQVRQGLNEFGTENMGLGDLTMPFASIGSTSAHVAVDYTAGAVTGLAQVFKLMNDVKNGRYVNGVKTVYKNGKPVRTVTLAEAQRAAVTNAGRGITGLGLVAAFAGMAAAGILKVHDDKDKDKRGLEQAQNLSGAQLNIDAALRGLQGKSTDWQADDLVVSVDFLEPFNAQMYLGYLLSQDESVLDAVAAFPKNAYQSVMSSIADMPAMQGMQEALDLLNGTSSLEEFAESVIGSTASGFIPGWLRQMAQVIDPYYRDTSGDTATDAAINQVKAAIPGLSQTLPKKYSGLGQEQMRDDDWISGIFNTMVNPGDADRIKTTEVTDFLDELYDLTGDLGIYPDAAAPKSFDQDKKTYTISTKEETETYQKAYGSEVNKLYSEIIKSADFKGLDETDQAAVLEKAKDAARALAKSKISGKYTPPTAIKDKPIYKTDAQAILDAYIEAKKKAEKEAQKEAAREAYLATKTG